PSFTEIVELAEREAHAGGRPIGIIPEIKNSTWFHARGLHPEQAIVAALDGHAYLRHAPFAIQSFEVSNLRALHALLGDHANIALVQLIGDAGQVPFDLQGRGDVQRTYAAMLGPAGLAEISRYAQVVAAHVRAILPLDAQGGFPGRGAAWLAEAHALGLHVHAWTLRPENRFLPAALRC